MLEKVQKLHDSRLKIETELKKVPEGYHRCREQF